MLDVHVHLQDCGDKENVFSNLVDSGIQSIWLNGTSPQDWEEILRLCYADDLCLPFCGVHPWYVNDLTEDWATKLEELLQQGIGGIGEMGLDKTLKAGDWKKQVEVFQCQWDLAIQYKKPVIIHCVKALNEFENLIKVLKDVPAFLMHSFMGSEESLIRFIERGGYFSISPRVLIGRSEKVDRLVCAIPEDRLLIETDFPYVPQLQKDLSYVDCLSKVYERVAMIRGVRIQELKEKVFENGKIFTH